MSAAEFKAAVEKARVYERGLADWLGRKGWHVLPVYDFCGLAEDKAPKLQTDGSGLVLPDLLVCRDGRACWLELKQKQRATLHRMSGVLETGISLRLWGQYRAVKAVSGLQVWLVFAHVEEDEVLAQEIDMLEPRIYDGPRMGRGGMAFFDVSTLIHVCRLSSCMVPS